MNNKNVQPQYIIEEITNTFVRGRLDLDQTSVIHNSILKEVGQHDLI